MLFSYSEEYACTHLFDAAYCMQGSYSDSYWVLWLKYGKEKAIKGFKAHLDRKTSLPIIVV